MGVYINTEEPKENWIAKHGKVKTFVQAKEWNNFHDEFLVCIVDNGIFTAAGVAFCEREKEAWLDTVNDTRPKTFWAVPKEELLKVSNLGQYLNK